MPVCGSPGCGVNQSKLNVGNLCKTCFAAQELKDPLKDLDLTKPLKNANLGEIVDIFKAMMNPIEVKLEKIGNTITTQDAKITLLQANLKEKDTIIATLTNTICNMQSSLNHLDADKRSTNIIVAGMLEGEINNNEDGEIKEDELKIERLLHVMKAEPDIIAAAGTFDCCRIGQARDNSIRLVKVDVKSKAIRDRILEKAPQLKHSREPWKKVYVKKDVHPVYSKETSRIYKKMKELKEKNPDKDVKILDGKLMVDDKVIDKNLFFH